MFNFFLYRLRDDYPGILEDEGMNEMLQRIPDTFTKLLSFINTMLDYAEAGRVIGKQEMVSMDKVLRAVVQNFEYAEKEGMVYFEWEGDFPEVWCDPVRMVQVWQNLISNAIKYRGEKNPVQINLGGSLVENRWKFWVEDNGPGIPEDEHENIFQPFVRVDHDTEGSGIGLATTERILKAHGGQIQVEQKMTEGARFVFELPKPN